MYKKMFHPCPHRVVQGGSGFGGGSLSAFLMKVVSSKFFFIGLFGFSFIAFLLSLCLIGRIRFRFLLRQGYS